MRTEFKIVHLLNDRVENTSWCDNSHETIFDFHITSLYDNANCWVCKDLYQKLIKEKDNANTTT